MYFISLIMDNIKIKPYKWDKKRSNCLFKSCNILDINECQVYQPIYSLYFHIHNTKYSHKIMDLDRKYYLIHIHKIIKEKYYNSNLILEGTIFDSGKNINNTRDIFCKTISILEPIHCINNNYNLISNSNYHLP